MIITFIGFKITPFLLFDLKWEANTLYICAKAYKKMWILRRMKILNVEPYILFEVYMKEIRSVLELAVPAWHSALTKKQSIVIERVQKVAVSIILSDPVTGKCEYSYDKLGLNWAKLSSNWNWGLL